jgi:hypothetical protein
MGQPARVGEEQVRRLLLQLPLVWRRCLLAEGRHPLQGPGASHKSGLRRRGLPLPRVRYPLLQAEQAVALLQRPQLLAC